MAWFLSFEKKRNFFIPQRERGERKLHVWLLLWSWYGTELWSIPPQVLIASISLWYFFFGFRKIYCFCLILLFISIFDIQSINCLQFLPRLYFRQPHIVWNIYWYIHVHIFFSTSLVDLCVLFFKRVISAHICVVFGWCSCLSKLSNRARVFKKLCVRTWIPMTTHKWMNASACIEKIVRRWKGERQWKKEVANENHLLIYVICFWLPQIQKSPLHKTRYRWVLQFNYMNSAVVE